MWWYFFYTRGIVYHVKWSHCLNHDKIATFHQLVKKSGDKYLSIFSIFDGLLFFGQYKWISFWLYYYSFAITFPFSCFEPNVSFMIFKFKLFWCFKILFIREHKDLYCKLESFDLSVRWSHFMLRLFLRWCTKYLRNFGTAW